MPLANILKIGISALDDVCYNRVFIPTGVSTICSNVLIEIEHSLIVFTQIYGFTLKALRWVRFLNCFDLMIYVFLLSRMDYKVISADAINVTYRKFCKLGCVHYKFFI